MPAPYMTVASRPSPAARTAPAKLDRNQTKKTIASPVRMLAIRISLCLSISQETSLAADALYFGGLPYTKLPTRSRMTKTTPDDAAQRSAVHLPMCPPRDCDDCIMRRRPDDSCVV